MFTIIRHARSELNEGITLIEDCNISEYGRNSAKDIIGDYDIVICSTLKRTQQTLRATKITFREIRFTEYCNEIHDSTEEEIIKQLDLFKKYVATLPNVKILIISHGLFIRRLLGLNHRVENLEPNTFRLFTL